MMLLGLIIILVVFISFIRFAYFGVTFFSFGCGRRFKKGRKCAMWSCPNSSICEFSKYYIPPKTVEIIAEKSVESDVSAKGDKLC